MSYNTENMWDSPRPPFGAFRGRAGEPYTPRWPHGAEPRMRGRGPLPFRGGAMPSGPPPGPPYTGQGGPPFNYRDAGRGQEGTWEESRPAPKEQMNIPRRGVPPANFRDVADTHYSEQGSTPDMDYREKEVTEQRKWTTPDVDYRAEESKGIAYRVRLPPPTRQLIAEREIEERKALELEHRKRLAAALDYRQREAIDMEYKIRLAAILKRRDRDEMLLREKEYTDRLMREKEVLERIGKRETETLGHGNREAAGLGLENREASSLGFGNRDAASLGFGNRDAASLGFGNREAASLGFGNRDAANLGRGNREASGLGLRDREASGISFREREVESYTDRELPTHVRKSVDLDLRVKESDKGMDFIGSDRGLEYRENLPREYSKSGTVSMSYQERQSREYSKRGTVSMPYQESLSREYSKSGTVSMPYKKQEKTDLEYMDVEHQKNDSLKASAVKENAGFTSMDMAPTEMPYRQGDLSHMSYEKGESKNQRPEFQKHIDSDYREKECTDSDYRDKESSDSDYRSREGIDLNYREPKPVNVNYQEPKAANVNYQEPKAANVNYRETKAADSDYREKENTDSDYRERKRADTDYRQSAEDYSKESLDKIGTSRDFLTSSLEEDNKGLAQVKVPTDYPLIPKEMEEKTGSKVEIIPFLAFSEDEFSTLMNLITETRTKPPGEDQAQSGSEPSCSGKLDTDFRDRPIPEAVGTGVKERAEQSTGYKAKDTPEELCSGDQDLRSKDDFAKDANKVEGDQDLRPSGPVQKDEDLRGGETKAPEEFFTQNSLLMDFLRLAAKELREKTTNKSEAKEEPTAAPTPADPDPGAAKPFQPDLVSMPAAPVASGSNIAPEIQFLCREDTDYRSMDFNDVDLRVGHRPEKRLAEKRPREDPQPGSKDKDYRRTPIPEGATKVIWLDGLPTGASREEILCALGSAYTVPEEGVNLIGYIPGYSLGSVCVEFSLVEEAVGCMEANKGVLHFRGKKVNLKYIPYSDRWSCLQCQAVNVLSKERCWQCSALRAGSDHLSLRDAHKEPKTPPILSTPRSKKRKSKRSPSGCSPDRWKEKTPPRERSPPPKTNKGAKLVDSESATVIIRNICLNTSPDSVVKALQPYAQLSPSNVRIMKNRKSNHRGFGFIDLKNHKEAIRLTVLVRELNPPLIIDGRVISVDLAVGQRRNEGKSQRGNKSSPGKNRKQRGQRKPFTYPGYRANAEEGPSYIFDPKTGCYVDPLMDSFYNDQKAEQKKDDYSYRDPERDPKESQRHNRRGFTEEKEADEDSFKKPLPPPVMKKEEPAEPKVNPLLGLIGAYVEDSDEEEEEEEEEKEEEVTPPLRKKPAYSPPPPAPKPEPKPVFKPAVIPPPKPMPKPMPKSMSKSEPKATASTLSSTDYEKLIDWKKMVCLLCRRQFPSKEVLLKHKNLSDLHKQNIALHEKIKKSQKELEYLQQREQEENQCIQRRLQQAKKELEMLEREEEGAQQEAGEGLDTELHSAERRKSKGADTRSELMADKSEKKRVKSAAYQRPTGESYRENMKRLILERYKELE